MFHATHLRLVREALLLAAMEVSNGTSFKDQRAMAARALAYLDAARANQEQPIQIGEQESTLFIAAFIEAFQLRTRIDITSTGAMMTIEAPEREIEPTHKPWKGEEAPLNGNRPFNFWR